jgi:FtsP/CotA-like multicopper oxidase with cupredoxin domain
MRHATARLLLTAGALALTGGAQRDRLPEAVPNDNRTPAGESAQGVLTVTLEARLSGWRPDLDVDSAVTVAAFGEPGEAPRIPGPLVRATSGTEVRVTVRSSLPEGTLVVHGLRAGTVTEDTVHVPAGTSREVRYRASAPGTYLYWATTTDSVAVNERNGRDSQLTGAIVIDPIGIMPDPQERIFVLTVIDMVPDTMLPPPHYDIWELAINGLSWPHSEQLDYDVGSTVRWRLLNGSYLPHPMHLHGFHFRVVAKGDGTRDRMIPPSEVRHVVTEFMPPGSTFAMEWQPTRAGSWLFHCHMVPHISPFPERPDSVRRHDEHDLAQHARAAMAGLVLGIRTFERHGQQAREKVVPQRRLRLLAQERESSHGTTHGYVLQEGAEPARDSVQVPGPPIVVTRGETTAITVVNHAREHTTVHWHGMELESGFDGVAGWSGTREAPAPLILPGDSFTVAFTPPRAGTYLYHTHMDESAQLRTGMYGPLLVVEPGARYDPERDLVFMLGRAIDDAPHAPAINGRREPRVRTLTAGTTYRLRLINILPAAPVLVTLGMDSVPLTWRPISKDGADLPSTLQVDVASTVVIGVGETYDMAWTPRPGAAELSFFQPREGWVVRQRLEVR